MLDDTPMTPDHTAFQVHSSGYGRVRIGRFSREGIDTGRYEMAPVHCPCNRLAALHGASQTILLQWSSVNAIATQ